MTYSTADYDFAEWINTTPLIFDYDELKEIIELPHKKIYTAITKFCKVHDYNPKQEYNRAIRTFIFQLIFQALFQKCLDSGNNDENTEIFKTILKLRRKFHCEIDGLASKFKFENGLFVDTEELIELDGYQHFMYTDWGVSMNDMRDLGCAIDMGYNTEEEEDDY